MWLRAWGSWMNYTERKVLRSADKMTQMTAQRTLSSQRSEEVGLLHYSWETVSMHMRNQNMISLSTCMHVIFISELLYSGLY